MTRKNDIVKYGNGKIIKHVGDLIAITNKLTNQDTLSYNPKIHFENGNKRFNKKDYTNAIKEYLKATELNPDYPNVKRYLNYAYFNRGNKFLKEKRFTDAINDFTKAIEINPTDAGSYNSRAIAKEDLYDFEGAIIDYTMAIEIDAKHLNANKNLQRIKRKLS